MTALAATGHASAHGRERSPRTPSVVRAVWVIVGITVLLLAGLAPPASAAGLRELAEVRRATAEYHRLDVALADGYRLGYRGGIVTGCIAHPTDGAMGYHYFNWDLFDDPSIDPLRPEGLVYAPGPDGQRKLVAVEWVVPKSDWEEAGNTGVPSVLGIDMHILNPKLNWYIHHAWVWDHNQSGVFADWNPDVVCP